MHQKETNHPISTPKTAPRLRIRSFIIFILYTSILIRRCQNTLNLSSSRNHGLLSSITSVFRCSSRILKSSASTTWTVAAASWSLLTPLKKMHSIHLHLHSFKILIRTLKQNAESKNEPSKKPDKKDAPRSENNASIKIQMSHTLLLSLGQTRPLFMELLNNISICKYNLEKNPG